ncbi:MAG: aldo/keto reductase [Steroidobacteraceae bacterium]
MSTSNTIPAPFPARIGLGTWKMGESRAARAQEVTVVSEALQLGYRLINTAEMYGDGGAEEVVGAALKEAQAPREQLCIVSKVLPNNASRRGTIKACEASLKRLQCGYLDIYLLHWRGSFEFTETLDAFAELQQRGLIRRFGVSNLDVRSLQRWKTAEQQLGLRDTLCTNQVHYCISERGIEFDLLPWQREQGISTMAYSPLGLGDLAQHPLLKKIGAAHAGGAITAAQVALAWVLRYPEVVAIPKTAKTQRLLENLQAAQLQLSEAELAQIDAVFPPPTRKQPLAMI